MPTIIVTTRDGAQREVRAVPGLSIMEIVRDAGIADMVALCGGTLSCATCHVYVDERDLGRVPAAADDETEMLEVSEGRRPNSRLSCQMQFESSLDGLSIVIAP